MNFELDNSSVSDLRTRVEQARARLNEFIDAKLLQQLDELAARLRDNRRYVAVFGAFSAGKSSLINAMLGKTVLTVSPHPTTATITEIETVGTKAPDDPIRVEVKSADEMWEDVSRALRYVHVQADNLDEAMRKAGRLKSADFPAAARRHVSFLRAASQGYEHMGNKLGETIEVAPSDLARVTADESTACFLHRVNLSFYTPVLSEGTVLVDTPGVDSIHRRHTDVAFDYMRRADAVLFVLYYTHAFARADQTFLSQLAQVQNIVGVNKLFVVINAVDLAQSDDERRDVSTRVVEELRSLGITEPRIYEVSSQIAVAAERRLNGDLSDELQSMLMQRLHLQPGEALPSPSSIVEQSGIPVLGRDLRDYLLTEAYQLAASSVHSQFQAILQRLSGRVTQLRQLAQESENERLERERARLRFADDMARLAQQGTTGYEQEHALGAEWEELRFHIGERVRLSLSGIFRAAFHPGLFQARGNTRKVLQQAAAEFLEIVSRGVEAELRTLAMRMQSQADITLERMRSDLEERIDQNFSGYVLLPHRSVPSQTELPHRADFDAEMLQPFFRYFSSPRQFFEEGGQKDMLRAVTPIVVEAVQTTVLGLGSRLERFFLGEFRQKAQDMYEEAAVKLRESTDESLDTSHTLIQYEETLSWLSQQLTEVSDETDSKLK